MPFQRRRLYLTVLFTRDCGGFEQFTVQRPLLLLIAGLGVGIVRTGGSRRASCRRETWRFRVTRDSGLGKTVTPRRNTVFRYWTRIGLFFFQRHRGFNLLVQN